MSMPRSVVFLGLFAATLCAAHCPKAAAQQQFRVAGVVVDSVSGAPIERAEVTIAPATDSEKATATLSASNGAFAFSGLAPGKYRLTAGRVGYTIQGLDQHENFMTAVAVGPKFDSEHVRFRLSRESVISGIVFDEFGEPLRDAELLLFERRLSSGSRSPQFAGRTSTDDIGEYRFPHLAPGTYFVVVHAKPWYGLASESSTKVRVSDKSEVPGENQVFSSGGLQTLSFVSSDSDSDPRPPDPRRDVVYPLSFYSNSDSLDSATPLVLSSGSTVTADFSLRSVPSLHIFIKAPSARPEDSLSDSSGSSMETFRTTIHASLSLAGVELEQFPLDTAQRERSYFELKNVPPGEFVLTSNPQSPSGVGESSIRKQISSNGIIDLSMSNMATVSGLTDGVRVGPPSSAPGGIVAGAAGVAFVSPDRKVIYGAALNQKGEFTLSIPAGRYTIDLHPNEIFHAASIQSTGAPLSGHTIDISPGSDVRLAIHGVEANCAVTGTVLKNGKPFAGAMIILVPEDSSQDPSLFHRDQSDSDGSFSISPVLPGRYTLLALENGWDLEWSNLSTLFPYLPAGVPLDLKPASSISTTVKVQ